MNLPALVWMKFAFWSKCSGLIEPKITWIGFKSVGVYTILITVCYKNGTNLVRLLASMKKEPVKSSGTISVMKGIILVVFIVGLDRTTPKSTNSIVEND